jgi:hypothetical protein
VYQALVDRMSRTLIGALPDWVYGWRLPRQHPTAGEYRPNNEEWEQFRDHLGRLAGYDGAALTTDVVSFFASIELEPLSERVLAVDASAPGQRLVNLLEGWYGATGRGLPQRSSASAVLAHAYLRPLDDLLASRGQIPPGGARTIPEGRALRWMDDIWLFGRSLSSLRESQLILQAGMRDLGVEMNLGKTRVLVGGDMVDAVFQIEHSAVDSALALDDPDPVPLDELIDAVLAAPELAERTSIRFMTTRMRTHELFDRVDELCDAAPRMPQAADHLARLLRDSGIWRSRQEWYVQHGRRWRDRLPWMVAQWGTMFPSGAQVDPPVIEFFTECLATIAPLPLLSVASQRVAAWIPGEARVMLRDAAARQPDALSTRALALALLHAGETPDVVRRLLRQHEDNAPVLARLEDANFNPQAMPVSHDFAG